MSKRCPECLFENEDERVFCASCGEPLDIDLRLIMEADKISASRAARSADARRADEDDNAPAVEEEKSSVIPWIILGLVAVAAVVLYFVLT